MKTEIFIQHVRTIVIKLLTSHIIHVSLPYPLLFHHTPLPMFSPLHLLHSPSSDLLSNLLVRQRHASRQHLRCLLLAKRSHSRIIHVRQALASAREALLVALVVQVIVEVVVDAEFVGLKYVSKHETTHHTTRCISAGITYIRKPRLCLEIAVSEIMAIARVEEIEAKRVIR
jgi:hypothetical protein